MSKILLPYALYEDLEKIESLNPDEMRNFLSSLQKYCESTGKDFSKVCNDIGLEVPSWAGKLTHKQNVLLNSLISRDYYNKEDEGTSWSINPETGRLDIIGKFKVSSYNKEKWGELMEMGIKIGKVKGYFDVSDCGLSSSEGFPLEVTGDFNISNNKFTNLVGCPLKVGGRYKCDRNKLTSLEGAPELSDNFDCSDNSDLRNLKGGPKEVTSTYYANRCNLNSLEGFATKINPSISVYVSSNNLYTLEGIPLNPSLSNYRISCSKNPLKGEVLTNAYKEAARTGSWIVGYLSMFTDPEFIKTGKAPKDPIREKLAPANLKKEIETNGEAFVVGLKSIWKDFRVQKILKGIEIPSDTKADAELLADLDDVGL
jgi:hypothetical protein